MLFRFTFVENIGSLESKCSYFMHEEIRRQFDAKLSKTIGGLIVKIHAAPSFVLNPFGPKPLLQLATPSSFKLRLTMEPIDQFCKFGKQEFNTILCSVF